ncbi:MAG: sensor histidine kinase [Oscillibacter sp.]|nr:sensor histidine kinase [Oscillibacter sp.]
MSLFSRFRLRSHMRLFLTFIITFILPLLILTAVFLNSYQDIYTNEVQQSFRREMDSVATTMDTQLQTAATYVATLAQDTSLQEHLRSAADPSYPIPAGTPTLRSAVQRYATNRPNLLNCQVIVLSSGGRALMGGINLGALQDSPIFQELVRTSYRSPLKSTLWIYEQQFRNVPAADAYVYVVRPVADPSNWQNLGYIILRFRNSDLVSMFLNHTSDHRSVFILDSTAATISSIDNLKAEASVAGESHLQMLLIDEPIERGDQLIYTSRLSNLWYLTAVTESHAGIKTEMTASIALYITALLLCILLAMVVSYIMSRRFMVPVKELTAKMHEAEEGNLHSRAIINTHDEFEDLANSYNKMIQRVEDLMRQVIFEQEQKRESDIRMLQAQINPHFLYNTLASIRYMIYTSPPAEVDRIIRALSRFLKYVLSNAETVYVTLDREFEQMNDYITIQQYGFEVPLQYKVDIEPGLGRCLVVKMLFQPLIENAILHGLKLNNVDPTLHIHVYSGEKDNILIDITDNGAGFDVDTLSQKTSKDPTHHHLGISNVQQRLWLHYGESCTIDIQSEKGRGTTVRISIPKLTEEDMEHENTDR